MSVPNRERRAGNKKVIGQNWKIEELEQAIEAARSEINSLCQMSVKQNIRLGENAELIIRAKS